jgi:hypothetical protein
MKRRHNYNLSKIHWPGLLVLGSMRIQKPAPFVISKNRQPRKFGAMTCETETGYCS